MSQEPSENVLGRSLDAIDAVRRRMMWAGYVAVLGTFAAFFWLDHVIRTTPDIKRALMAVVLALAFLIAWSTFALAIVMLRMTKRILRAIDLASKR